MRKKAKMKKINRAVLPGTFDPFTNGHLDLIQRGLVIFDEIIIAVAPSHRKKPLFTLRERLRMIAEATRHVEKVKVESFNGLLIDYVRSREAAAVIRGLRAVSDFEYEMQMALMNRRLSANVETVFMMPSEEYTFLTASLIKEVAFFGGNLKGLVPENVEDALKKKFRK